MSLSLHSQIQNKFEYNAKIITQSNNKSNDTAKNSLQQARNSTVTSKVNRNTRQKHYKLTHKIAAVENCFNNSCHECSTVQARLPTYTKKHTTLDSE